MLLISVLELESGLWTSVSTIMHARDRLFLTQAADQYPECEVIGIDLSPSQPTL